MHSSFFANLVLLLSAFYALAFAEAATEQGVKLTVRQNAAPPAASAAANPNQACADYSRIANLSVIGTNTSYRAAFFSKSLVGSLQDKQMFSQAQAELPKLTADVALNQQCGNLTKIALTEAEKNLTQGIVAQFTGYTPVTIKNGNEVILCVLFSIFMMTGVWSFMK